MDRYFYFLSAKDCPIPNCGDDISLNNKPMEAICQINQE